MVRREEGTPGRALSLDLSDDLRRPAYTSKSSQLVGHFLYTFDQFTNLGVRGQPLFSRWVGHSEMFSNRMEHFECVGGLLFGEQIDLQVEVAPSISLSDHVVLADENEDREEDGLQ